MFKRQKETKEGNSSKSPGEWEHCEVLATEPKFEFNRYVYRFFARASSPKETYTVRVMKQTCNGRQPDSQDRDTQMVLNELKVTLFSEGWELLAEKGSKWYSLKFRRAYKPNLTAKK